MHNSKLLRKISKYIGVNYNDLMYASGLGSRVSPFNPYLLEHYSKLRGKELIVLKVLLKIIK